MVKPFTALCALCVLAQGEAPPVLFGVAPDEVRGSGRYASVANGASFKCADGSEVPSASVNDNFCDCTDGSDEPGTAACAGRSQARFYCRNEHSVPKMLYSSRVLDGICDCCDGSDEGGLSPSFEPNPCLNTCEAEGAALRAERERKHTAIIEGLRVLQESEVKAKAGEAAWRAELADVDVRLVELEQTAAQAKARKEEAQAKVDTERKQRAEMKFQANESEQGLDVLFAEDFEGDAVVGPNGRWASDWGNGGSAHVVQDPEGKRGRVLMLKSCTWGGDAFSRQNFGCGLNSKCKISFWARGAPWQGFSCGSKRTEEDIVDAHSWLAVPKSNRDFPDRLLSTRSTDDWAFYEYDFPREDQFQMFGSASITFSSQRVHIMLQAHASTGQCKKTMFDDFKVWQEPSVVKFTDADGDTVEFRINAVGGIDVYANDEEVMSDLADLSVEGTRTLYFQEMRTMVPEGQEALVARVMSLWHRRPAAAARTNSMKDVDQPPEAAATAKGPEVSEYAKWALDQTKSRNSQDEDPGQLKEPRTEGNEWTRISSSKVAMANADRSESEMELQNITNALKDAEKLLREAQAKKQTLVTKLKRLESGSRWFSMIDACPEKQIQEYNYKICYFGTSKQGHTDLGKFSGWDPSDASVLLFKNGRRCHDGPARTLRVILICGPQEEIRDIDERSRCAYEARVVHPAACTQEQLKKTEEAGDVVLRPHESHDEL